MSDPYLFPGTSVLKNRLGVSDAAELARIERRLVVRRFQQGLAVQQLDFAQVQANHKHLFQDIYEWAGQVRSVELSKGGHQFLPLKFVERGIADLNSRLLQKEYLSKNRATFATEAAKLIGDLNYIHPFREGNGRTQLLFLAQMGREAGHSVELNTIGREAWMHASREAHHARYEPISKCIETAIDGGRARTKSKTVDRSHER